MVAAAVSLVVDRAQWNWWLRRLLEMSLDTSSKSEYVNLIKGVTEYMLNIVCEQMNTN